MTIEFFAKLMKKSQVKMMIVMRKDLKMGKGKIAAQSGHACVAAVLSALEKEGRIKDAEKIADTVENMDGYLDRWFKCGMPKICVSVNSEEELLEIDRQAKEAGIISELIRDAGITEFHGVPTYTCLAMEPVPADKADLITGKLPLY